MYLATITVPLESTLIKDCFSQEEKDIQGRAHYTICGRGKQTIFDITAKDCTALRTTMNSITKLIDVIEKTKDVK